jgi:membrane-bound lytic murein transglycosylase B
LFAYQHFKIYDEIGDHFRNAPERTTPTLDEYKKILGFHAKIIQGVQFVRAHKKTLEKAARLYGIPADLITAIIGVESSYGKNYGSYNPFNVYVSMIVVDHRSDFAKAQLKQLLSFARRTKVDIFSLKSSYAGAISYAQFIPHSLNKWFVGDDIFSMHDNIMSVGNYLAYFKRKTGSLRTPVLRYNSSTLYRDAVLDLADAIGKQSKIKN